ncbi:choline dehydrogenase-like flavoprotein [Prauserella shujinwangii]|uniref:Choline dehydrogenase-like flavoprotein n=1 Tax=Prauserella shujinwangii TaxID=1453103 RepID=A0A2T0LSE6_9PSEU|nr:GMC family oxidoreductase [Prauserella shujinwangii]PRX46574.1 choline dehydrogenase-like flavoprotein [Prauserella shujinwangii]
MPDGAAPRRALTGTVGALLGLDDVADARAVAARVEALCGGFPPFARAGLHAGAGLFDATALLLTGRRLDRLDPARRDAFCRAMTARPTAAALVDALKLPALLASGGQEMPERPALVRPDAELDCVPAHAWPARATADAVVIGSGAGGAMAARELARAGLRVIVVEEGRRFGVRDFRTAPPAERFGALYRDGGATAAVGVPPVLLPLGRAVGGSTVVNSGTCYRPPERVLGHWRAHAGVELVDRFAELVPEVERTLRVAEQPTDVLGRNGLLALRGAERLGWRASPLRRNAPGCGGCCQCAVGCPRNAKYGVHLNALPQACAAGARIVSELRVDRVLTERGHAAGIAARRPDGSRAEILAPLVVVAAGATETPPLLRRSGLGRHPELGRNLALHPALSVAGRFAEPVESWRGVLQSVGIERWHDDGILLEATAAPPGMGTFVLPGTGSALRAEIADSAHLATLGAMIADAPSGRVHGRERAVPSYRLTRRDEDRLRTALCVTGEVLFAAGAREVLTGLARHPRAGSPAELRAIAARVPARQLHLAAFHPTGTARMGADGRTSPVDATGALRGVRGVYVADASVLPSCPTVNPQVTIMAMALAIAGAALDAVD